MQLLDNPKFAHVVLHFVNACAASRAHDQLAGESLDQFGDHGSLIAGVVRNHFPAEVKDRLRELARSVTRESDLAYAARPKYTRHATIRTIGRLIAQRDGHGFYGPRA